MTEQNLPNNCLLKKTKDKIEINIFKDILKKFGISGKSLLILDNRGSHFISNYFSLTEVIGYGIFSIESLYLQRKPYKQFSAIYIISADKNSIEKVMNDFISEKDRLYKFCHIFVLDEITDNFINLMINSNFIKHIKTLKQILIKYISIDKNLFSFGNEDNYNSISNLYGENEEMNKINIQRLVSICINLDNYPNIVYFNQDQNCKLIAEKVNSELKKYFSNKKGIKKNGFLLITSRFIDFVAPVQFDLIYQHLLLEILKKNDLLNYNKIITDDKKEYTLDYKDTLYIKYKNMFIYEVMKNCSEDLDEFKKSDVGKLHKIANEENIDLNDAAKNVTKYQYYINLFSKHINLSKEIDSKLKKRNILELLNMQKTIISNINSKGKKCPEKDIISMIKNCDAKIEKNDYMRLLCLIKYYYPEFEINEIFGVLESNSILFSDIEKKIINYLSQGKCLVNTDIMNELNKNIISFREKYNYDTEEEKENKDDKRYVYIRECKLTTICDMCCKNQLPNNIFTFVEKPENIKTQNKIKIKLNNVVDSSEDENIKQNLILFNIGGLSNYEISSLERGNYIKQYDVNLILGANKIYNYKEYFNELKDHFNGNNQIHKIKEVIPKKILESKKKGKINENKEIKKGNNEKNQQKINVREINDAPHYLDGKTSKEKLKKLKNSENDSFGTDYK